MGLRRMGREGSLCLGLVTLEHLTPPPRLPTQDGHPGVEAWMGPGSWGEGTPGGPRFSVFGAAQRKMFSRWEAPYKAAGSPEALTLPAPSQSPLPCPGTCGLHPAWPSLLLAAQLRCTSQLCPTLAGGGGMKVQTVVPLWAGRHQGGGVAPGCKALAEEALAGGTPPSPDPTPVPQHGRTLGGCPALPLGPTGRVPIALALRGA